MGKVPDFLRGRLQYFEKIKLRFFQRLLEERATSAVKMVSEIFLKQIRRLNYDLLYKDSDLKNRRVTALIYDLTQEQFNVGSTDEIEKPMKVPSVLPPSEAIFNSAKIASEMGTTLWFSEEDKNVDRLKNLVSCGQFTACYNLLKYCVDIEKSDAVVNQNLLKQMKLAFQNDWEGFIKDPYWLHRNMDKKSEIAI